MIEKPGQNGLLMASYEDVAIGFCLYTAGEYFCGAEDLITTLLALYVRQEWRGTPIGGKAALRLISGVRKWSDARDIQHTMLHATSGLEMSTTDKLLRRLGFKQLGGNYVG